MYLRYLHSQRQWMANSRLQYKLLPTPDNDTVLTHNLHCALPLMHTEQWGLVGKTKTKQIEKVNWI